MISRLFAYGTLERRELMAGLTGRVPPARAAVLAGFRRGRLAGRTYPGLVIDRDSEVEGTLYLGLTPRELARLDRYEGPEYRRVAVGIRTDGGRRRAWVYVQRQGTPLDGPWESVTRRREHGGGGRLTG